MNPDWNQFWNTYRNFTPTNEHDLFVQVGKTVNRTPIPQEVFNAMLQRVREELQLTPSDHLVDFCCGNGLVTHELAAEVARITAVDFTEHLIRAARDRTRLPNVTFIQGDVLAPLDTYLPPGESPNKFLLHDALAYFEPAKLETLLAQILEHVNGAPIRFFIAGVPDRERLWDFYNTPERKQRFLDGQARGDATNDGLGRWWERREIEEVCRGLGLNITTRPEPMLISHYRFEATIDNTPP